MAIPKVKKEDIIKAVEYIEINDVPKNNQSTTYKLVYMGKEYPPKYVIAVADHLANGKAISTEGFNAVEAVNFLERLGFKIQKIGQEEYEMTITAADAISTDSRFSMDDLGLGDKYEPIDVYYEKAGGEIVRRKREKRENKISNQTMSRLLLQVFESEIIKLTDREREEFPICRYTLNSEPIKGIFPSIDEFKKHRKTIEYLIYKRSDGKEFVIYCWNIFSTIIFIQECLRRFGEVGDKVKLIYKEKAEKDVAQVESGEGNQEDISHTAKGYKNKYSNILMESKNIIFRGAPGTGKSYLAKEIATDIVSNGMLKKYNELNDEQKEQIEFVQFHPSYDYTDFVEGLRPKVNKDGSMGFELQAGIFKRFVDRARKNYENSQKSFEEVKIEASTQETIAEFLSSIEFNTQTATFFTKTGNEFIITDVDDKYIYISIPNNANAREISLELDDIRKALESDKKFSRVKDVTEYFGYKWPTQEHSYYFVLYNEIRKKRVEPTKKKEVKREELKNYVFIIDEINRGEISKIFGELFFSIDPGYRGEEGKVSTQYANLHSDPQEKFYIPDNVYIIGTMNDIDRSVDSFDFAMRRRFRFIELKANEQIAMLDALDDKNRKEAIKRMVALNNEIVAVEELNENYQIGAAYFLKLDKIDFDQLWTDYLRPLLQEYIQGMYDEVNIMDKLEKAYRSGVEGDED